MADHVVVVADRLEQGHVEELAARLAPSAAPSDPGLALAAHEQPAPVRRVGAPLLRPRHLDGSIPKSRLTRTCAHWRCPTAFSADSVGSGLFRVRRPRRDLRGTGCVSRGPPGSEGFVSLTISSCALRSPPISRPWAKNFIGAGPTCPGLGGPARV